MSARIKRLGQILININESDVINSSVPHGKRDNPAWEYSLQDIKSDRERRKELYHLLLNCVESLESIVGSEETLFDRNSLSDLDKFLNNYARDVYIAEDLKAVGSMDQEETNE